MSDIFPEDGYNPDTGEYEQSDYNFDPIFTGRVEIAPGVFATIESSSPNFDPLTSNIFDRLEELVKGGFFDIEGNRNPSDLPPIPDDFDFGGKTTRGPFIDMPSVNRFLDESGLEGIALFYYDAEHDEYWADVNTE